MGRTMKAILKAQAGPGLQLADVPIPEARAGEALIRIRKTAICGTDLHIYNWDPWSQQTVKPPLTIGHEYVGVIEAVGDGVHDLRPGMLVSGEGHIVCGRCRNCLAGRRHLCPNTMGVGVNRPGAFAEYLCIPAGNVWVCDPGIPEELYSIFDPFGNAVHTALSFDVLGEDVLITGAGPIGLMACAVVKHAGARSIVVTDVNPYRLALAEKMGATVTLDATKGSIREAMKSLGMKEGFDVGLEMSGNGKAFADMIDTMFNGGHIALLGIHKPDTQVDWNKIVFKGLHIKGIYGREMYETWYKMTTLLQSGLDISPVITHRFPYAEFEKGFAAMIGGNCGKVVLNWEL
jgi:threonine 3-dehydrogenase